MANMKSRYRNTIAGFLWVVLNPILLFGAQAYAFHYILRLNIEKYPLFLTLGLLPWVFIVSSLDMSTSMLVVHGRMLKSFPIKPATLIVAQIADNFVNYVATILILLLPLSWWQNWPLTRLPYMILPLISLFAFVTALTFLASSINVLFRDTRFIVNFVLQFTYFLTPIFYPSELIPAGLSWIKSVNIFYLMIRPFQILTYDGFETFYWNAVFNSVMTSVCVALMASLYWGRKKNEIYFQF